MNLFPHLWRILKTYSQIKWATKVRLHLAYEELRQLNPDLLDTLLFIRQSRRFSSRGS